MASVDIKISGQNLLKWSNMEDWVNGASAAPTRHTLSGASATIARQSSIIKVGTYSAGVTRVGADATLYHDLDAYADYLGRKMTFGCWVYATVASRARIAISDGVGSTNSSYHTGVAGWEYLEVTHNIATTGTRVRVEMHVNTGNTTAYFDNGVLCDGDATLTILTSLADWSSRKVSNRYLDQSYSVPRRDGQKVPNMRIDSKAISFDAMVVGATPTARRTNLDNLLKVLNSFRRKPNGDSEPKQIYFFDDRYFNCFINQVDPEEIAASRINKLRVKFDIFDPFEYSVNMTRVSQAISGTTSFTVANAGNAPSLPTITLTNSSSTITSLTIENLTTGQKVSYSGSLVTSTSLVINAEELTVENNGTGDLGNVTNEIGISLIPGNNEMKVTGVVSGTILVDWANRWY